MIDAICDLLYVTYGAAIALGIDVEPFFAEVHRSNMSKLGLDGKPIYREDGKVTKPSSWSPPNLRAVLANEVGMSFAQSSTEAAS
jgi:predicted HAD superfamily Cof-like phosphohydrolase